jgi:hypothetical protein
VNLLEKFEEYFLKIEESLSTPSKVDWIQDGNNHIGLFEINGNRYRIEYFKQIGENYSLSFSYFDDEHWNYEITNIGNGFRVLSTIIKSIDYVYNLTKPDSIIFSAIDDNTTRKRLYEKYCKDFCEKFGFKFSNRGNDRMVMYVLFDDNVSNDRKEMIFQSVKKIVEEGK